MKKFKVGDLIEYCGNYREYETGLIQRVINVDVLVVDNIGYIEITTIFFGSNRINRFILGSEYSNNCRECIFDYENGVPTIWDDEILINE